MKAIDDNFITIQGWMRSKLDLKGPKLLTFALVYGFCQDRKSKFTGSISYIANWVGCSDRYVISILAELCEEGLITKELGGKNGFDTNSYSVNHKRVDALKRTPELSSPLKKDARTPELSSPVPLNSVHPTPELSSPNNIEYNIEDNIGIAPIENSNQKPQLNDKEEFTEVPQGVPAVGTPAHAVMTNPAAYLAAADTLHAEMLKSADERIRAIPKSAVDAYFSNIQKSAKWFDLILPVKPAEKHKWISRHTAAAHAWHQRDEKWAKENGRTSAPEPATKAKVFTGY